MQKKTSSKYLFFIALTIIVLVGCSDDDKKTCTLTSASGVFTDGSFTSTFTYDNGKLISQVSTNTGGIGGTISMNYVYDSEGRMIEMNSSTFRRKFMYNNIGKIITSEDYSGPDLDEKSEYEYTDGRVAKIQFYESDGGSLQQVGYDVFEYANASVKGPSKITHHNENGTVSGISTYEYDKKKIKIPRGMDELYRTSLINGPGIENYVIKQTYTSSSIATITTTAHRYNSDGYLIEEIETTLQGSNTTNETYTYNYTCN